jgi:hypothetical protein
MSLKDPWCPLSVQGSSSEAPLQKVLASFRATMSEHVRLEEATCSLLQRQNVRITMVNKGVGMRRVDDYTFSATMGAETVTAEDLDLAPLETEAPDWTRSPMDLESEYTLADAVTYARVPETEHEAGRIVLFHGTSYDHLMNMIKRGVQPRGGPVMGAGFYVSADPNVAKRYRGKHKDCEGVVIEFSMKCEDTQQLRGRRYQYDIGFGKRPRVDFWQNIGRLSVVGLQHNDFCFPKAATLRLFKMEAVYIFVDDVKPAKGDPESRPQRYLRLAQDTREAQRKSREKSARAAERRAQAAALKAQAMESKAPANKSKKRKK